MKVEVITRHAIANYGSILQAIATQQVVEDLGCECEIIDYIRTDENYYNREKTLLEKKKNWRNNYLKRFIYLLIREPESIHAGRYFEKARSKFLNLTKRYSSIEELRKDPPKADIYITGSDQVWGETENGSIDPAYCLSFVDGKKISYASSFGNVVDNLQNNEFFLEHLSLYKYIFVREDVAVSYLRDIGLKASQVLDPTLLYGRDYWNKYVTPIKKHNYILIYQLHNDSNLGDIAKRIANREHKELIRISSTLHQISRPGRFVYLPTVGQFLEYIRKASLLITDSFHGTAFAINFQTQFIEILPNNRNRERNESILRSFGLSHRIISSYDDYIKLTTSIDYHLVGEKLESLRNISLTLLQSAIERG